MLIRSLRLAIGALAVTGLVAACGGGGDSASSGNSASPSTNSTVVSGTVTGLGQVSINGVSYAEGDASVAFDVDPRSETPATLSDLKLGQQVEAQENGDGKLSKVLVRATVMGAVQTIDLANSSFQAVGQTIQVVTSGDAKTVLEGIASLADLKVNDWVEVHGTPNASGVIIATRVEVKPASAAVAVRVGGLVKAHDAAAKTFKLGDLTINYANAALKPQGAVIDNNLVVYVYATSLPTNNSLNAVAVRVARQPTLEGQRFSIGGLVTDAAADGKTFKVAGLAVDASKAQLKGGQNPSFADIKDLALVRVEGVLSGATTGAVLQAERVWLIPAVEQRTVVLFGQVTDFVSTANFKLRGVTIDADNATYKSGAKADLKEGAFVQVTGRIEGAKVVAREVKFNMPPKDVAFRLLGTVSEYDANAGSFKLLGIPMQLDSAATFEGGAKADLSNGDLIEVRGAFNGVVFVVNQVEFKPLSFVPLVALSGLTSDVTEAGFKLNGSLVVKLDSATQIKNGPLANGQQVEVKAKLVDAELVALEVEVQLQSALASLRGPVADLNNAAKTFTVNSQLVDYSTAEFRGASAAELSNGDLVKVSGSLDAGKVKATVVQFLRR